MSNRRIRPPPEINEEERPHAGHRKKATRRWCKGRRGVEHVWAWRDWMDFGTVCRCSRGCLAHRIVWLLEYCRTCGRHGTYKTERRPIHATPR